MKPGDLVHVIADNCDLGLGVVVSVDEHRGEFAHRVLTRDGRCLYYFPFELHAVKRSDDESR